MPEFKDSGLWFHILKCSLRRRIAVSSMGVGDGPTTWAMNNGWMKAKYGSALPLPSPMIWHESCQLTCQVASGQFFIEHYSLPFPNFHVLDVFVEACDGRIQMVAPIDLTPAIVVHGNFGLIADCQL